MIDVIKGIEDYNFSKAIPDLEFETDEAATLALSFLLQGSHILETYDIPPIGGRVKIKLASLFDSLLSSELPNLTPLTIQPDTKAFDFVSVNLFTPTVPDAIDKNIYVIKGFVRPQPFNAAGWLATNWLSLGPSTSKVYYHQPICLSVFPHVTHTVIVSAKMLDNTTKTLAIGEVGADHLQHIILNPGALIGALEGEYQYFEVYTEADGVKRHGGKRFYYAGTHPYDSDTFMYRNRFGGFDVINFEGNKNRVHGIEPSTAFSSDIEKQYFQSRTFVTEKNTGFLATSEVRSQAIDFLQSEDRYHFHEGRMQSIILEPTTHEHTRGSMSSFTFSFRYSQPLLAYPELGSSTSHLII